MPVLRVSRSTVVDGRRGCEHAFSTTRRATTLRGYSVHAEVGLQRAHQRELLQPAGRAR